MSDPSKAAAMTRAAVAVALALVTVGASGAVGTLQAGRPPVTIPFELAMRHVIVQVTVNKSRPLSFVLDTGASVAIVRMATATELGLTFGGSVQTAGAGAGTQPSRFVENATWSLVGLEGFAQPVVAAVPLPELPSSLGREVDGILGGEFIRQFVMALDYESRIITLHDREAFRYVGSGQTLPLTFTPNGHPVVNGAVTLPNGTPIDQRFLLDIGSGGALVLHSPFVAAHGLSRPEHKSIPLIGAAGAGGRIAGRLGRVTALQIGRFTIDRPITIFAEDQAGAFADATLAGNIGAQIASRFRTTLDYGRRQIILEPSTTLAEPFDRAFSGLSLLAEGADYRTFRVREVLAESPATDAGIQADDVITSIDGTAAADLTLTTLSERLERGVPHELTLRRGSASIEVVLTPRKLI